MIELIPFAGRKHINVLAEGYAGSEMLPLPPAAYPKTTTVTVPATGTLAVKTLEAGTTIIELICKSSASHGFYWRWHTAADTDDCTSSNAHGYLNGFGDRIERGVPDGAVAIQAVGDGGDSEGVLIEYYD